MRSVINALQSFAATSLLILTFLFLCIMCNSQSLEAADFLTLRKASIEGGQYLGTNHDPYILLDNPDTQERLQHTTNMNMNIDLACTTFNEVCFYWNNTIASKASSTQYRMVSWIYRLGFSVGQHLEFGWSHISSHELDRKTNTSIRYPIENIGYIELKFVDKPRRYTP